MRPFDFVSSRCRASSVTLATAILTSLAGFLGVAPSVGSMTASPWPFEETQPDGSRIELYIRGGEAFHWLCDARGFTVVRHRGWFVFASRNPLGDLDPTDLRVGREDPVAHGLRPNLLPARERRPDLPIVLPGAEATTDSETAPAEAPPPPSGLAVPASRANLVVLLRFSNHATRTLPSEADIDVLMNAPGGHATLAPSGSVRDAYLEYSYGRLALDSTVAYWVTLPNTEAYYANGSRGLTSKTHEALRYALNVLEADPGFSFRPFDQNGDGAIDAITFLHSGYGAEWGGTSSDGAYYMDRIWSHKSSISSGWVGSEGVRVTSYHISPALWGKSGSTIGRIGVICHETGHFLGLPDLYDGGDSDGDGRVGEGLGSYCLMANSWGFDGSQRFPPHPSAWSKVFLGWVTPGTITSAGTYALRQAEEYPDAWRIDLGYPSGEYLLIENRQRVGFDGVMPQGGLAIYHIDTSVGYTTEGHPWQTGWPANGKHYRVALLAADGTYDLERGLDRGDGTDLFHAGGVDELGPNATGTTHPNTDAYKGGVIVRTDNRLFNISAAGPTMTFDFQVVGQDVAPNPPSGATATARSSTRIDLAWADQSANEDAFLIERSSDGVTFDVIASVGANTAAYADTGVAPATTYAYRVCARNGSGTSAPSNTTTATTLPPAPEAPSDALATAVSATHIQLRWTDNSATEEGFVIERSLNNGTFTVVATVPAETTLYEDTTCLPATTYGYRVSAYHASEASSPSNTASATTPDTPLAAPSDLTATAMTKLRVSLTWRDNSSNEKGFRIERATDPNFTRSVRVFTVPAGRTTYTDSKLTAGVTYAYRVRAYTTTSVSEPSSSVHVVAIR